MMFIQIALRGLVLWLTCSSLANGATSENGIELTTTGEYSDAPAYAFSGWMPTFRLFKIGFDVGGSDTNDEKRNVVMFGVRKVFVTSPHGNISVEAFAGTTESQEILTPSEKTAGKTREEETRETYKIRIGRNYSFDLNKGMYFAFGGGVLAIARKYPLASKDNNKLDQVYPGIFLSLSMSYPAFWGK